MIKIEQPAIAFNSDDVPGAKFRMDYTYTVPTTEGAPWTVAQIMGAVTSCAAQCDGGRLKAMIINCHGRYGNVAGQPKLIGGFGLSIGQGIDTTNTGGFCLINGLVDRIWITACGTAREVANTTSVGRQLCGMIAANAGAEVIASDIRQLGFPVLPRDHIDNYEGTAFIFYPDGSSGIFYENRIKPWARRKAL